MAIKKPIIKPVVPPVRPPIEPLEVLEEELPPVEPIIREVPLAEEGLFPSTITEEGWEYSDIVWSVEGEPLEYIAISPEGEEFTKAELDVALIEREDYGLLYEEYQRTGGELDIDSWYLFRAPIRPIEEAITSVFPGLTPQDVADYIETDWEGFIDDMATGGYTEEKADLLEQIGFSPEDVADFYRNVSPIEAIPPEGIEQTINPPSLPAGYGQPATVRIMPDWEFVDTTPTLRSNDYLIFYEGKQVGKVDSETGGLVMDDPGFWWKAWVPSLKDRLYLSQSGQVPPEAFSGTPLIVQRQFSDWLYTPKQIGETTIPSPATILSAIGAVGTIAILGYYALQGAYQVAMSASLKRNLRSWAKSANVKIPPETERAFVNQAVAQMPKKFMLREAIRTFFKPTKVGYVMTEAGIQEVARDALAIVNRTASSLVPTATQTGAMAMGGLPPAINASIWATMSVIDKTMLVQSVGLESQVALKAFETLTPEELMVIGKVTPTVPEVVVPEVPAVPEVVVEPAELAFEAREEIAGLREWLATEPASRLTHFVKRVGRMKGELPNITIQQYKDMTGKTTVRENILTADKKHVKWEYAFDEVATEMGIVENGEALRGRIMTAWEAKQRITELEAIPVEAPPAVEVAKPPVKPEVAIITKEQTESLNTLAKEKLIMTEEGKTKPQLRRLMKALTGKSRINQLTQAEATLMIDAIGRLEVKYGRPPVIPTGVGLITSEFAEKLPLLKEIGILEKVRPTRHVFEKMGLRQEVWKPAFEAEVLVYEEHQAFDKELIRINKLVGKDPARRQLVFRELENPGSQVGLTFDEKRAVTWFRKYFDDWADRLNLPENKRRTNYVTHIFEEEISRQLKEEHPIDPELIKALDFITPKTVFNPYLQRRLGQTIGLREDPFAAATAYEARALKVFYYEPLIQRIRVYQKYLPPRSARYLGDFINRITDRPSNIDKAMNHTIKEFTDRIRGLPGGEAFANFLTRGNPSGMVSYNLTSVLYTLWLGFKPTSAIRNLGQHTLELAEIGPKHFANSIRLRATQEGMAALKESLVLRSRRGAFIPAVDSSFASKWTDKFRESALWMFRQADKQNVSDAFLGGYSEAKEIFPNAPRELWINRGDEVAADTQYLYTKFNSFSMSQNSIGRVFSMLTTWTENWLELMTKWISVRPSQVYLAYTKETGQAMPTKNWSQTYKALLLYMLIVGLGYVLKEKTRLRAWEYTGLTSLSYLADIIGGDFPALEAPGAVADIVVGFVTDDERRLKAGWNTLQRTLTPGIIRQAEYVASGERDWLTMLFYLEAKDIEIKRLKNRWEKDFKEYEELSPKERTQYRKDNPLIEAKQFVIGQFTTLSTDKARAEVLRLIEEHKIDTELIDGYEKVFGVDTEPELQKFQNRLGHLEKLEIDKEAEYFTTSNFATEVNAFVKTMGRSKVERDGNKLAIEYLHATDLWETYYNLEEDDARTLWRQQFPDVEALLYLFGKVSSFKNPKSAEVLLGLMKKYNIPPQAIRAFIDKPERYDELFTQKFELEQKWFDQTTEYENFGNTEAPNYIEDKEERKLAREKFKEDNPDWVADMRRIEAIDNDATPEIIDKWAERGREIDKFGASSSEAKLWLLENSETLEWALEQKLLSDDLADEDIELLRLTANNRDLLEKFDAIDAEARDERLAFRAEHPDFDKFLIEVKGYAPHSLRETIRVFRETEDVEDKLDLLGDAVYEYGQLAVKDSLTVEEVSKYTWDIRSFDWKRYTLLPHLVHWGNEFYKIFEWLSREPDAEQLKRITERVPDFEKYIDVLLPIYQSEPSDKFPIKTWEALLYLTVNSYRDGAEKLIELVGEIGIPNQWDRMKVEIQKIPHNKPDDWPEGVDWYEDDWFFIEHPVFYKGMVETGVMKEKDFSKVPTREIFDKYLIYLKKVSGKPRMDYRWENPDFDAWGVLKFGWVSIIEQKRRAELTPTEEFLEDVAEKEAEFDKAMRELEELLKGLR